MSKHLRQPSVQACSKAERHAGRLRLAKREELLSHEQHWAAPPFWLDGTELRRVKPADTFRFYALAWRYNVSDGTGKCTVVLGHHMR